MKTIGITIFLCCVGGATLLAQAPAKPVAKPATAVKPAATKPKAAPTDSTAEDENALPQIAADKPLVLGAPNLDDPDYILLPYDLPYSGVVEIRLLNPDGKQVHRDQFVHQVGPNVIRLKRSGFKKPGLYTYYLYYKTKDYKGSLTL